MDKEELDEILGGTKIGDFFQGVKGFVKGESFGFFKYLSKIKNKSQKVIKQIDDVEKFLEELKELKPKVEKLTIAPEKKLRLINLLDFVTTEGEPFFTEFKEVLTYINELSSQKLSGERYDVVPDLEKDEIDSDLMSGKEEKGKDTSTPKVVTPTKTSSGGGKNPSTTAGETKATEEKKKEEEELKEEINRFKQLIK
jgi:hypothetical protein